MPDTPESLLDVPLLRRLAGDKSFARGEAYFADGRVRQLQAAADRATGRVEGSRAYRVKLWKSRGEFRFSCTCAAGQDHLFCKHCVALGLAWLAVPGSDGATAATVEPTPPKSVRTAADEAARQKLADHLRRLTPERLAGLVLEATDYDDILRRRLLLEAAGVARPEGTRRGVSVAGPPDFEGYRRLIREAIETADYVDYDAIPDYAQGVQEAIAPLRGLLREGYAAAVIELAEFALVGLDKASSMLDGSDGSLNSVYDDLQRFHREACQADPPDPDGLAALDAPVSGGVSGAAAATLTFMVGGEADAFARGKPVLEAMGKRIVHCGAAGAGQAAKICNNMILGATMIATAEAFTLAEKLGLSAQALFDVASNASGQSWSLTSYCPAPGLVPSSPANRDYAPGFAAALMLKDLRLSQQAAADVGATTPMGALAAQLYALFAAEGHAGEDFSAIIRFLRGGG